VLETRFLKWNFPDENQDPFFDLISAFYAQQDAAVFSLLNTAANIVIPPSIVSWDQNTGTLTWNSDFEVPLMKSGFSLFVKFGPDAINRQAVMNDGDRLVVVAPNESGGTVNANFAVVSGAVAIQQGLFTVGFRRGNRFYGNFPQVFVSGIAQGQGRYENDLSFAGLPSQIVNVSGQGVSDATKAVWAIKDPSNNFEQIIATITTPNANTVVIAPVLPAGSYRLIGIQ
jgi:hypothetical protein